MNLCYSNKADSTNRIYFYLFYTVLMEKLIKLLNESEKERKSDLYYKFELENWEIYCYDDVTDVLWTMQDEAMVICSKQFWFIQWLVENDKINYLQLTEDNTWNILKENWWDNKAALLMLLAIQDKPIDFLISILK